MSRALPVHTAMRNCTRDEGGPFEVGNQVLISSHRKLLSSKAMVVNVADRERHYRRRSCFQCVVRRARRAERPKFLSTATARTKMRSTVSVTSASGESGANIGHMNEERTTRIVGMALGFIFLAVLILNAMS